MARRNDTIEKPQEEQSAGYELYTWLHDLVFCLAFVTVFFVFFVRLVGVSGPSMTPTLLDGDNVVLLSNFFYRDVEVGDVVVMRIPSYDPKQPIVKRVIATEGQEVDINFETAQVYVDGVLLQEDYINDMLLPMINYADGLQYPVTVPEGCLFIMGDNRNQSADSRYAPIGLADEQYVMGKVLAVVWPWQRIGTLS